MDLEQFKKAGEDLYHKLHLPTFPVGVTYIKSEDDIPEQAVRPSAMDQKWSLCQAFTYARRHGWHVAMTTHSRSCPRLKASAKPALRAPSSRLSPAAPRW
jgi:uncharacterized protein (DUF169 family)